MTRPCPYGLIGEKSNGSESEPLNLPVKSVEVTCEVHNVVASVSSVLLYENTSGAPLECLFVFPLDEMSAVYHFQAEIDGRVIVAEIQEREEAKETYERAIEMKQTAFLLEQDERSSDTFRVSLGNLPDQAIVRICLKYVVELTLVNRGGDASVSGNAVGDTQNSSVVALTLPMVLNPRYDPNPEKASFQSGVLLNCNKYEFSFVANIYGSMVIDRIVGTKDTYSVQYENDGHTFAKATLLRDKSELSMDHDVELHIHYKESLQPHVIYECGETSKKGVSPSPLTQTDVVMLNFLPNLKAQCPQALQQVKSEFIFLIDQSGSMSGSRISRAKETLLLLLKSLPVGCYFQVVGYGSAFHKVFAVPSEYNKANLKTALTYQEKLNANMGGTEIMAPLKSVYDTSIQSGFSRHIFLLTDGDVGNVSEIIKLVGKHRHNTTVFAVGIGEGVNTALVKGVARAGGGRAEFVRDTDTNFSGKILSLLRAANQARVTDVTLQIQVPKAVVSCQVPTKLDSIYDGQLLNVFAVLKGDLGQLEQAGVGTAVLRGKVCNQEVLFSVPFQREVQQNGGGGMGVQDWPVHRLAVKRQIQEMTDSEDGTLNTSASSEVIALSKAFNLVSKYTSFVGVDRNTAKTMPALCKSESRDDVDGYDRCTGPMLRSCGLMGGGSMDYSMSPVYLSKAAPHKKRGGAFVFSLPKIPNPFTRSKCRSSKSSISAKESASKLKRSSMPCAPSPMSFMEESCEISSPQGSIVLELASLQDFDGSWPASEKLWQLLGQKKQDCLAQRPGDWSEKEFTTLLVVVYLATKCTSSKDEWLLLSEKAIQWLHTKKDKTAVTALQHKLESEATKLFS